MQHYNGFYLTEDTGNNSFCYIERHPNAKLRVPALKSGSINEVKRGDRTVFTEKDESGILREYSGLEEFIKISTLDHNVYIFDNHNHALYFRYREKFEGILKNLTDTVDLIHIDQHSDLNENPNTLDDSNLDLIFNFVQKKCNVGNFIKPALSSGLIKNMKQIRSEYGLLSYQNEYHNYILDIDLDFRAEEMGIENFNATIKKTQILMQQAKVITIATSPYFLDQNKALSLLNTLLATDY